MTKEFQDEYTTTEAAIIPSMNTKRRLKGWFAPEKRSLLTRYWLVANLLYDFARAFVVNILFASHGVNGFVYLCYALGFSAIFSVCSLRLIFSIADKQPHKIFLYGTLAFISFFAPDAYIVLKGRHIPAGAYVLLAIYLSVTAFVTARSILRDASTKR